MTNSLPWKDPPCLIGKPSINEQFSMATLNNQRVYIYMYIYNNHHFRKGAGEWLNDWLAQRSLETLRNPLGNPLKFNNMIFHAFEGPKFNMEPQFWMIFR